jgi:2'-5' RNA ligase
MLLTLQDLLDGLEAVPDDAGRTVVTLEAARAVVMGARGNAGVILSQIVRGVTEALPAAGPVDAAALALACRAGSDSAARAVRSPVDGTMLTVARASADVGEASAGGTARELLAAIVRGAEEGLARTPDRLDVLSETGVVDAGGAGLVEVVRAVAAEAGAGRPSALVVLVPEAEPVIRSWRRAYTLDGAAGMPGHVTLLYPFAAVEDVELDVVRSVVSESEPFEFTLGAVREWPDGVVYLDPAPAEPFVRLMRCFAERFPEYPPYGGAHDEMIPHVTVAHTEDRRARADAAASVARSLPIVCNANEVWLMHEVNGSWQRHTPFRLGR